MGVALIVKKLKAAIAKLRNQVRIGVKNARKYILRLIDCENKLASIEAAVQPALKPVTKSTPVQLNLMDFLFPHIQRSKSNRLLSRSVAVYKGIGNLKCSD